MAGNLFQLFAGCELFHEGGGSRRLESAPFDAGRFTLRTGGERIAAESATRRESPFVLTTSCVEWAISIEI
jgi:hypothetical protein